MIRRALAAWLARHAADGPADISPLDRLDGLPRRVAGAHIATVDGTEPPRGVTPAADDVRLAREWLAAITAVEGDDTPIYAEARDRLAARVAADAASDLDAELIDLLGGHQ